MLIMKIYWALKLLTSLISAENDIDDDDSNEDNDDHDDKKLF